MIHKLEFQALFKENCEKLSFFTSLSYTDLSNIFFVFDAFVRIHPYLHFFCIISEHCEFVSAGKIDDGMDK